MMHVAVLGAGIMGCSAALCLARRGAESRCSMPRRGPAGRQPLERGEDSPRLSVRRGSVAGHGARVLDGGLAFKPLIERLIGQSLGPVTSPDDDIYLVHRRSVVDADAMGRYYDAVSALVREHADAAGYLCPAAQASAPRLSASELAALCDTPEIVAGFRVPERSVSTVWMPIAWSPPSPLNHGSRAGGACA